MPEAGFGDHIEPNIPAQHGPVVIHSSALSHGPKHSEIANRCADGKIGSLEQRDFAAATRMGIGEGQTNDPTAYHRNVSAFHRPECA
jgi:hypothetical protein